MLIHSFLTCLPVATQSRWELRQSVTPPQNTIFFVWITESFPRSFPSENSRRNPLISEFDTNNVKKRSLQYLILYNPITYIVGTYTKTLKVLVRESLRISCVVTNTDLSFLNKLWPQAKIFYTAIKGTLGVYGMGKLYKFLCHETINEVIIDKEWFTLVYSFTPCKRPNGVHMCFYKETNIHLWNHIQY